MTTSVNAFFRPSDRSLQITSGIVTIVGTLFIASMLISNVLAIASFERAIGFVVFVAFIMISGWGAYLGLKLLHKLPKILLLTISLLMPIMFVMLLSFWAWGTFIIVGISLLCVSLMVGCLIALKQSTQPLIQQKRVLTFLLFGLLGVNFIAY